MNPGMRDKHVSRSVRLLQIMSFIVGSVLIIVASIEYSTLDSNLVDVTNLFQLSQSVFSCFNSILIISSYLRIIRNIGM